MNKLCKALALLCALTLLCAVSSGALARTEPNSKTIEETNTYDYGSLKITIDQWCYAFNKTSLRFFVANVYVDDPAQLKTAFAGEKYSKDAVEAPMDIAARHDAVLATNGDYYNFKDKSGLVIRGGELYRDLATSRHQLLVYADGRFEALLPADYKQGTGAQYIEAGVVQSFMFGPLLVDNYEITELPEKYFISTKDTIREPRTAIGQVDANHYVVIVADGRRDGWSDLGMTLQELQDVFAEQGCRIAYNLDGGGSATMVLEGERVNRGSTSRERSVSDIVYFTRYLLFSDQEPRNSFLQGGMPMRRFLMMLLLLVCLPACAFAAEGDPLLSVDDLLSLEDSYDAFLDELEELIVERGLLSPEEREAWRDAQMGDFYQNGGYGSILVNYMPGVLSYIREEETLMQLSTRLADGSTLYVDTMRRYTPQDSSLSGLMLTLSMTDESGVPQDVGFTLSSASGVFLKWDAMESAYVSVGASARSDGETVVWSDQTPAQGAKNPTISITIIDPATQETLAGATLTLIVDGDGYRVDEGALSAQNPG